MSDSITFDRAVEYYDATRGFSAEQERQIIEAMAAALGRLDGPVLELGIGTGRIAIPLQQRGYEYFGIDLSLPMMLKLHENAALRSKYNFPLVQGDITRLPYQSATFAAIVAVHVFHLVPRWGEAIAEARRILQPGGIILHAGHRNSQQGGADNPINAKWRELLQAEGYISQRKSSADLAPSVEDELKRLGAKQVTTSVAATWPIIASAHETYDRIASRQWSGSWAIPDDIFARAIAKLHDWVTQEYGDRYDTPLRKRDEEFFITKAQF